MDAKQKISAYVGKKLWALWGGLVMLVLGIVMIEQDWGGLCMVFGFMITFVSLCLDVPASSNAKKYIKILESRGLLEKAAEELDSSNQIAIGKNRAVMTENFLFVRHKGVVLSLDSVDWAYKHRLTQRVLLIPIHSTDSLMAAYAGRKPLQVLSLGGKDKKDQLKEIILRMYQKNPKMLVGYTQDNVNAFKQMNKK